jgi:thiol:disulfide interchange protein DsbD
MSSQTASPEQHGFINITSLSQLQQQLALARQNNKPVMLDLYADWCVACKEFEKYTFSDATVEQQMNQFILLRADVTKNSDTDIELLETYSIMGLPSLLFYDLDSTELSQQRITGFMDADKFNQHLLRVLKL